MDKSWEENVLPGPLYNAENMKKCLYWIKEMSTSENCLDILCAHNPRKGYENT